MLIYFFPTFLSFQTGHRLKKDWVIFGLRKKGTVNTTIMVIWKSTSLSKDFFLLMVISTCLAHIHLVQIKLQEKLTLETTLPIQMPYRLTAIKNLHIKGHDCWCSCECRQYTDMHELLTINVSHDWRFGRWGEWCTRLCHPIVGFKKLLKHRILEFWF